MNRVGFDERRIANHTASADGATLKIGKYANHLCPSSGGQIWHNAMLSVKLLYLLPRDTTL